MKNKLLNVLHQSIIRIIQEKIWSHATAGITHLKNKYQQKKINDQNIQRNNVSSWQLCSELH